MRDRLRPRLTQERPEIWLKFRVVFVFSLENSCR